MDDHLNGASVPVVLYLIMLLLILRNSQSNDSVLVDASPLLIVFLTICLGSVLSGHQAHIVLLVGVGAMAAYALWCVLVEAFLALISWFFSLLGKLISRKAEE